MEEAVELCEATTTEDIAAEAADLLYFALAKCVSAGIGLRDIGKVLDKRSLKITRRKGDAKKEWVEKLGLDSAQAVGVAGGAAPTPTPAPAPAPAPVVAAPESEAAPSTIRCQTFDLSETSPTSRTALLKRPIQSSTDIAALVSPIISLVRTQGDAGLRSLVVKFDRCAPAADASFPLVLKAPFAAESMVLTPTVKAAIDQAYLNIQAFHAAQMDRERDELVVETMPGVVCTRFARPIERVGIYVPGGTAILPSTALMLAVPAQVAQCAAITLATPPRPDGSISPEIVYIASITGVSTIVRAGGAQAVAAMAYGTETVPKVDKIFGPGNQFVTAAKMAVSMDSGSGTAIDMPAGPSEVLVRLCFLPQMLFSASNRVLLGHRRLVLRSRIRRVRPARPGRARRRLTSRATHRRAPAFDDHSDRGRDQLAGARSLARRYHPQEHRPLAHRQVQGHCRGDAVQQRVRARAPHPPHPERLRSPSQRPERWIDLCRPVQSREVSSSVAALGSSR